MKEALKSELKTLGFDVDDLGTNSKEAVDYPDFAHAVAQAVGSGKAWRGIMIDGAGIGSCIVANKVPGVRAGMAYDYSSAVNSREHNDTNVLTLGAGLIGVHMESGRGDRQIMFKDKDPDYQVDEAEGRVFNLRNSKELSAFSVDAAPPVVEEKAEKQN